MTTTLADRIRDRMEAIGTNPTALAKQMGRDKDFVRQLLNGRKKTVNAEAVTQLAGLLGCDPSYLLGTVKAGIEPGTQEVALSGSIESETWRTEGHDYWQGKTVPLFICPNSEPGDTLLFRYQGPAQDTGISDGALVSVAPVSRDLRDGEFVVVERRKADLIERSIRRVDGGKLVTLAGERTSDPIRLGGNAKDQRVDLVGSVVSAIHVY